MKRIDLTGKRFGKWRVLSTFRPRGHHTYWDCVCECGAERPVACDALVRRESRGCRKCSHLSKRIDLSGQRFKKLKVVNFLGHIPNKKETYWHCLCACGRSVALRSKYLLSSTPPKSCGRCRIPGKSRNPLYGRWAAAIDRCYNTKNASYKNYGGRGIKVCKRWHNFDNFRTDMHESFFMGATLERNNVDLNYTPSNCSWATRFEQARNKRNTVRIVLNGKASCLKDIQKLISQNHRQYRLHVIVTQEPL
jgi:hypothetical protein